MPAPIFIVAGPLNNERADSTFELSMGEPNVAGCTIQAAMSGAPDFDDFFGAYEMVPEGVPIVAILTPNPAPAGCPSFQGNPDLMDPAAAPALVAVFEQFLEAAAEQGVPLQAINLCLAGDAGAQWGPYNEAGLAGHFTEGGITAGAVAVTRGIAALPAAAGVELWITFDNPGLWPAFAKALLTALKAEWPGPVVYAGSVYAGGALSTADLALMPLVDGGVIQLDPKVPTDRVASVVAQAQALTPPMRAILLHHTPNNQPALLAAVAS